MSAALNNITAPDEYAEPDVAMSVGAREIMLLVNNQAIYWQRGHGPPGGAIEWNEPEEFLPPNSYVFDRYTCDAVRVRAAVPAGELPPGAKPAQVTVKLA